MVSDLFKTLGPYLQNSQLMPVIILTIAAGLLMMSMRRRRPSSPPPPPPSARTRAENTGSAHLLRRDLDDVMVELQDLSRRISAEIDTRFVKLEAAMKDADRRIAVLNRLARASSPGGDDVRAPQPAPAPIADRGNREGNGAPREIVESARVDSDVRHTVIYELADAGFTPIEIARDLGRTPGEVELILNLRRQSQRRA